MRSYILFAISCGLFAGCQTSQFRSEQHRLQSAEVKSLFSGHTVESFNLNTRNTSFTYYGPDGRVVQERLWSRRTGSWKLTADGQICLAFHKKKPRCRHIVRDGERYYKVLPDESGKPVKIVRYRYFSPGNALAGR